MIPSPCSDPPKAFHGPQHKTKVHSPPWEPVKPGFSLPHSLLTPHPTAPATQFFRVTQSRCSVPPHGLCTCCAHLLEHLFLRSSASWPLLTLRLSALLLPGSIPDLPNRVNLPAPLWALKSPWTCQSETDILKGDEIKVCLPHQAMSSLWARVIVSPVPGTQ